jgi:tRNA (guanine-N7-)-methyltransferase
VIRSIGQLQMLKPAEFLPAWEPEIIPPDYFAPLDIPAIYGRAAPLEVDLGCGDGSFLVACAEANPARDYLGIERLAGRVRRVCRKISFNRAANARVLRVESSYAVQRLLPPASVEVFHLLFPDPWPKRRHWGRRLVTEEFLAAVHRALVPEGTLRIATDQLDYFREIERVATNSSGFIRILDPEAPASVSTFEKRFREDGLEIHRLVLRRVSVAVHFLTFRNQPVPSLFSRFESDIPACLLVGARRGITIGHRGDFLSNAIFDREISDQTLQNSLGQLQNHRPLLRKVPASRNDVASQ